MGIVIRQSLKASFVTYFGVAIGSVNQLWVATKILTEAELGLTRSLFMMGLLFYSIFNFGGPSIADRYFSRFRDDEARHHGFLTFLLLYTGFYFLLYMAVYFGGKAWFTAYYQEKSPELVDNYFLLVWLTGFNLLQG
ncbi:MAG: polysaccharide biosynthesis protein, partial [Siphonobacter aquaeclarae]|nr:polysaccharide biosynthesis protein [Siphonobacter aquaeclarae]